MEKSTSFLKFRLTSFSHAYDGLKIAFSEEANFRIHIVFSVLSIASGYFFRISTHEWMAVILSIGLVLSLEIINTAIENVADFIHPEKHTQIKRIKDLSAGAVLVGAVTALIIGLFIFIPKALTLIQNTMNTHKNLKRTHFQLILKKPT